MSSETRARVADASVVGAFYFGESRAREADLLLAEGRLHAPSLLPYELSAIARKKASSEPNRAGQIQLALQEALAIEVKLIKPDFPEIFSISRERNLSVYDASYVWVAKSVGGQLLSFDQRLLAQPESRPFR